MAVEEMSIINASYDFWDVKKGDDWAEKEARNVASHFLGIDGHQNHGVEMEQFNWPALCELIANSLRRERAEG